tara:strand:- start:707 stop:1975 length:1269 start_codon:yes stop_codon:yes gene_type:complete
MSLSRNEIEKDIADLERKIANVQEKARDYVKKKDQNNAMRQLKQKKVYEKALGFKQNILSSILQREQQQISSALAGDISPERKAAARRRRTLKKSNGIIHEDARIPGMVNRPCFTNCEKKSWCDPSGWCDTSYYCTPSNKEGTAPEPNMKDQKCVPVSKKTKGGKKRKTKKSKKSKRKRKNSKRGGMRRKMNDEMITSFINPHSVNFPKDCCPCVFKLLGMPSDLVAYYQQNFGNGFTVEALQYLINFGYPNYHSEMKKSPDLSLQTPEQNKEVLNNLFAVIPSGMAAIGGIERGDGSKHCVTFAKNNEGKPFVFDAQAGMYYPGVQHILEGWCGPYGKEPNIKHLFILNSIRRDGSNAQLMLDVNGNDVTPAQEVQGVSEEAAAQLPVANVVPVSTGGKKSRKKRGRKKKTKRRKRTRSRK